MSDDASEDEDESSPAGGVPAALRSGDSAKDKMFAPKKTPKVIRVLTVLAYMLSVSLAAIMLSLYYVFLWDPKTPAAMRRVAEPQASPPCQPLSPQPYSAVQTTANPAASISPVIKYLTRVKTTTQPTDNITAAEEDFASPTRPLHGT